MSKTRAESAWMDKVASAGCCICWELHGRYVQCQVHHVKKGGGKRSNFSLAGLCVEHHDPHRTGSGFHGMGEERFCKIFRVPGESEYGLLEMTIKCVMENGARR